MLFKRVCCLFFTGAQRRKKTLQQTVGVPSASSAQRRFSSDASVKLFSLTPSVHGKKLVAVRSPQVVSSPRKKPKPAQTKQSTDLNLSTLSQAEADYSKNASQNLSALIDDNDITW